MNSARLARRWQEAGGDFARMAEALNEEISDEIATKADLRSTEDRLETRIEGVRTDLQAKIEDVRSDLRATEARLETKIEASRADLIKWIGGMMVLQVVAIVGLVRLLFVP